MLVRSIAEAVRSPSASDAAASSPFCWRGLRIFGGCLKTFAQVRDGCFSGALEAERGDKPAVLVHQVDDRRVVHGRAAVIERHLLEIDPIRLGDRSDVVEAAGEADQMRIETRQII